MGKLSVVWLSLIFLPFVSCSTKSETKSLLFKEHPTLKIGFSTQNFQKAMPATVESLTELIIYATKEGYNFIELRDDQATLSQADCKLLANLAKKNRIDVIYEIQKNVLDSGYFDVFKRGLANTLFFQKPGILRALVSKSEFGTDSLKKGWSKRELIQLARLSDSCALLAKREHVQFIVENLNEPFFGDNATYFGLTDFFNATTHTGFQFDIGNPFRNSSKQKADPKNVAAYLSTMGKRWVTTHLKTLQAGESQPILTENALDIQEVVRLMGKQNVRYVTIELLPVADKYQCFVNHEKSIQFLKDKGILRTE